jgi:alpha-N-arabinofuranosidase
MYLPFQDATFVPVTFDAGEYRQGDIVLPRVDAVAVRATDGKLWLSLVTSTRTARPTFAWRSRAYAPPPRRVPC